MDFDSERSTSPASFSSSSSNSKDIVMLPAKSGDDDCAIGMMKEEYVSFSPENLKFSIQNILRPDFGYKIKQERLSPSLSFASSNASTSGSLHSSKLQHANDVHV